MLARRRLTEAQLWSKLELKGYADDAIVDAVATCKRDGYLDDRLFAALYVQGARKPVGDARLVAELVKRGIDRAAAGAAVADAPLDQHARIEAAYAALVRTRPELSYQSAARGLERLGFPTALIYRVLREHARERFAGIIESAGIAEALPGRDDHVWWG